MRAMSWLKAFLYTLICALVIAVPLYIIHVNNQVSYNPTFSKEQPSSKPPVSQNQNEITQSEASQEGNSTTIPINIPSPNNPQPPEKPKTIEAIPPDEVVKKFFEACMNHDYDLAHSFWEEHIVSFHPNPLATISLSEFITSVMSMTQEDYQIAVNIKSVQVNGGSAKIVFLNKKCPDDADPDSFTLIKINGEWKIIEFWTDGCN